MKIYTEVNSGVFTIDKICIQSDSGNRHYVQMLAEIEAGEAEIIPYVEPPATWASVRAERNKLLKDTDWQGMSDVTMSDAQTAYRKKLRDLPATNADPTKIVFPDAP
jgi:hypothetical protein